MFFRWLMSKTVREALTVHKHYRRLLAAQRDLLSPQAIVPVEAKLDELLAAIREGHTGRINIKAEELQFAAEKWLKPYPNAAWRENVEVLLVALAVAMAIRTFFLQPFKIPTGSMQPTLFGVIPCRTWLRLSAPQSQCGGTGHQQGLRAANADSKGAWLFPPVGTGSKTGSGAFPMCMWSRKTTASSRASAR